MRMGKGRLLIASICFLSVLLVVGIVIAMLAANPLRNSETRIKGRALEAVPFGSSQAQLAAVAKAKGWEVELELHTGNAPDNFRMPDGVMRKAPINGEFLSRVSLGHYTWFPIPIEIYVESYWIFNSSGKLTEMYVTKTGDGP